MNVTALPTLEDLQDKSFNPFEAEATEYGSFTDPYARLRALRRTGDVLEGGIYSFFMERENSALKGVTVHMVLGYDLVWKVLMDPALFTNEAFKRTLGKSFGEKSITMLDPPEHTGYRRIFQKAFSPKVVAGWGDTHVAPAVNALVEKFEKHGGVDLVPEFTRLYPFQVIYRQLGLDEKARGLFHKVAITQTLYRGNLANAVDAGQKLGTFLQGLLDLRRQQPSDDLVTHLSEATVDGERLPDEVIVAFFRQLLNAAGDTTFRGTSNILAGLLTHPEQLDAVRADRSLIPRAIDEGLRWEGPSMTVARQVAHDTELGGVVLPEGSVIDAVLGSANHDAEKFADPERFDIFRKSSTRPLPFGTGPHVCIGQHLAKVEITEALKTLFDRLPNLRLDPSKPPPQITGFHLRAPAHLHVVFDR